ncbi:Zinc finger protein 844 [Lemmus lemmus]
MFKHGKGSILEKNDWRVSNVEKPSFIPLTWPDIGEFTQERKLTHVDIVVKLSCIPMKDATLERSVMHVINVAKHSDGPQTFTNTKEFTAERNSMHVNNVEKPSSVRATVPTMKEFTLQRKPMFAKSVGKHLCFPRTFENMKEFTLERNPIHVNIVENPSPMIVFITGIRKRTLKRCHMYVWSVGKHSLFANPSKYMKELTLLERNSTSVISVRKNLCISHIFEDMKDLTVKSNPVGRAYTCVNHV